MYALLLFLFIGLLAWFQDFISLYLYEFQQEQLNFSRIYYMLFTNTSVVACLIAAAGPWGKWRLAPAEFKRTHAILWIPTAYCAVIGMDFFYWSVTEPLLQYQSNPFTLYPDAAEASSDPRVTAVKLSFFHWGIHPWSVLCMMTLVYRWFSTLSLQWYRSRWYQSAGHLVLWCGAFALAAILANGSQLLTDSVTHHYRQFDGLTAFYILLAILLLAFLVIGGKRKFTHPALSVLLIIFLAELVLYLFAKDPSGQLGNLLLSSASGYISDILELSVWLDPDPHSDWQTTWTIYYWSWWVLVAALAAPYLGRITRGYSMRATVVALVLIPTLFNALWITSNGGLALLLATSDFKTSTAIFDGVRLDPTSAPLVIWLKSGLFDNKATVGSVLLVASGLLIVLSLSAALFGLKQLQKKLIQHRTALFPLGILASVGIAAAVILQLELQEVALTLTQLMALPVPILVTAAVIIVAILQPSKAVQAAAPALEQTPQSPQASYAASMAETASPAAEENENPTVEIEPAAQSKASDSPKPESMPEAESGPTPEPEPEPEPEPKSIPKPQPEAVPQSQPGSKSEPEPESVPETAKTSLAEPKPEVAPTPERPSEPVFFKENISADKTNYNVKLEIPRRVKVKAKKTKPSKKKKRIEPKLY